VTGSQTSSLTPAANPDLAAAVAEPRSSPGQLSEEAIIYITSLGHALCHVAELVFTGVMLAIMREFQLEPQQTTALALLGYMLMGLGALPVGVWADAWGPTRLLRIYFVGVAAASLAVAAAPSLPMLFLALTGLGLALSIYHPAGLAMLSLGVKARGRALGINGVAGNIGLATGPLLGSLAAWCGTWRLAYVVVAGLALTAAVLMRIAAGKRLPLPAEPCPRRFRLGASSPGTKTAQEAARPGRDRLRSYFPLFFLFAAMMLGGLNYRCLVTALPVFLSGENATGSELAKGGVFVFLALAVGALGQYFGGWVADWFGARRVYLALIGMLAVLAAMLSTLEGALVALPAAGCVAFCLFAQQPVENSLLAESTSAGRRSAAYGTKFVLTFGVGALGAHVVGMVWHRFDSVAPVFYLLAGSAVLMAVLVVGYLRSGKTAVD
jgi:MFS family permease